MKRFEVKSGMRVFFGRENGKKTLGVVVKCNPAKAVISTLEPRGSTQTGTRWHVPYQMLEAFDSSELAQTMALSSWQVEQNRDVVKIPNSADPDLAKEIGRLVTNHGKQAVQIALLAHG